MNPAPAALAGEYQILTSAGPAGISVVRVRGTRAARFIKRHVRGGAAHTAWRAGDVWRAALVDEAGAPVDDILVSAHANAPAWDVRLHLHGNPWLVRACAAWLVACGLTEAAEQQTTLWPVDDALEAEALALLPRVLTLRGARWVLSQVERLRVVVQAVMDVQDVDEVRRVCREVADRSGVIDWFTRPIRVVLAGPPNVGKSTLANALADRAVSLVSPVPGTTRDWVEVPGEADGFPVVWLDTAGLRAADDALEAAGIAHTGRLITQADAVVVVLDAGKVSSEFVETYGGLRPACVVLNKVDLAGGRQAARQALPSAWQPRAVPACAPDGRGLDALVATLMDSLGRGGDVLNLPAPFTPRQADLLRAVAAKRDRNRMRDCLQQLVGRTG